MNALRIALISMICILAQVLAACAVELSETGTNTVTGAAIVQGDIFALQPSPDTLYSGMWAHVYIPEGNDGVNAGSSKRTVLARTESRPAGSVNEYTLKTGYGDSTVTAEASKSGALGTAEAFSEVSAVSVAYDGNSTDEGGVYGIAALTAYISHTGTGTANASANGSADYEALMNNSVIQASGSVAGSAALGAANSYGGTVTGTALKVSESTADSLSAAPYADSECYGYISLQSGRNTLSAESTIHGNVSGSSSGMGLTVMPGTPGMNASSQSSTEGNLFAVASTYKIGDSIKPGEITAHTFYSDMITRLDDLTAAETGAKTPLYEQLLNGSTTKASAYLLSHSWSCYSSNNSSSAPPHQSFAQTESFTSAGVTRELNDANAAYGVSYISNGALSTDAYTSSAGNSPITLASAGVEEIKMGSGARLVGRLTGASPASTADLTVESTMAANASGSVKVTGDSKKRLVGLVAPSYSSSGTSKDAAFSGLTAENISGTAMHAADATFAADSKLIADDIGGIDIWSWASGDDPRLHAQSSTGLVPFVSTPVYTSNPAGSTGVTEGPTVASKAAVTSRSVDTVFGSSI